MNTPIYDFLINYKNKNISRLHMPGHKGRETDDIFGRMFPYDITEIAGADSLFEANGIIAESEKNATSLFRTKKTIYSTGGSTLSIQTMLSLACKPKTTVISARNAHKAFINSCALLDLNVAWIFPKATEISNAVSVNYTADDVEELIKSTENVSAVYVTSPDYYGKIYDIKGIAEVCHKHDIPLLVDNAHGAYLAFLGEDLHPIHLGADMCVDSAHKTMPTLTGAGYLHINNEKYIADAKNNMVLFGSTSPSYLIMASLDRCNKYIEENMEEFKITAHRVELLKFALSDAYTILETEPFKLTVETIPAGIYGTDFAQYLREQGIECEYSDYGYVVLMFSVMTPKEDYDKILKAMQRVKMPKLMLRAPGVPADCIPKIAMTIREATFAENEELSVEVAVGRICGKTKIICPPGIPLIVPGEVIDENCVKILNRYRISNINVVK